MILDWWQDHRDLEVLVRRHTRRSEALAEGYLFLEIHFLLLGGNGEIGIGLNLAQGDKQLLSTSVCE